jgi:type I restriction-modification system DNA methylase subunit/predicted type IV restriction endonuclease
MPAPQIILELMERFDRNLDAYKSGSYNETQARHEFIDPFFEALGWDVNNQAGNAEAYKDVIHEDAVKVSGVTKAPDYSFRIGGQRKFFVEAKKPSVNIKDAPAAAFQVRRYAWSAKLPLSIVTDFEELAVYDCRIKPDQNDKADNARVQYYTYRQYAEKWDEIAAIFSKDAILKGSFDKYAESNKAKRGTAEVDSAFLAEIESWRDMLAHNIALRNSLGVHELNDSVQRIIDRIIFLRIAEDRGIEDYGSLRSISNGSNTYARLQELCYKADDRYNSGLFHFRHEKDEAEPPDNLTTGLTIDDKPLKDILKTLYYPDSPYEFAVLPADILGQVYEQFLGKVIRLTSDHRAVVEDKPEVKKAGGVFYTPTYIVEYIVKNTVGKLLEGKTPKKAESLRILDPACGSGSFLLGAYQYLLDWHLKWYVGDDPEKWAKKTKLYQAQRSAWHLTTAERKRILLNNIYGVDIDSQAVEVTKLSLLLKVLEGETGESLNQQRKLFHERALPNLGGNIKCGNSLIGPDFYEGKQMNMLDTEETHRVNVFDWQTEFPEIFKAGGFDAVIGNPPYVRIQGFPRTQIDYMTNHYKSAKGNFDLYVSFVERGYNLLNPHGSMGKIIPNKFFKTDYGEGLRELLAKDKAITEIVDFGANQVFNATTYTCLLFLSKLPNKSFYYTEAKAKPEALLRLNFAMKNSDTLDKNAWGFASKETAMLLTKLSQNSKRLLDLPANMSRGSSSGNDDVFVVENKALKLEEEILRVPVFATDFNRYKYTPSSEWRIIFPYVRENDSLRLYTENEIQKKFPKAYAHLLSKKDDLKNRKQYSEWYGFSAPRNLKLHDDAQILIPLLADHGIYAFVPQHLSGQLCPMASGGFTIALSSECIVKPEYVLGLLNSRLLYWELQQMSNLFRGGWITCTKQYFGELPIRNINFDDHEDKAVHDKIVSLVEQMLDLHKQLPDVKTSHEQTLIQRQIDATDWQIDKLVYELYGLTEEEIAIVEGR